jgi:hypothetical protein
MSVDKRKRPASGSHDGVRAPERTNGHVPLTAVASAEALDKSLRVTFADGLRSAISYKKLGIDPRIVDLTTLKTLPATEGVAFVDRESEPFVIGGSTLRYLADKAYAIEVDGRIRSMQPRAGRLDRLIEKGGPPKEWFETPQSELF